MDVPKQNVSVVRSSTDQSLYCFYLAPSLISQHPQIRLHSKPGDLVKRGAPILDLSPSDNEQFTTIKSPLTGHLLKQGLIQGINGKEQKKLLFSIKLCQHYPRENTPAQAPQNQPKFNAPIFSAVEYCAFCDQPLWFYYQKEEVCVTYSQLVSNFDEFNIHDFQWKVILNQHFTKNTQIGSTSEEEFSLSCCGKAIFLENVSLLKKQSYINPNHIMMKYKKAICKHQKISNNYCQFCLMSIADIGIHKFKRYLFQVASQSIDNSIIVSGKALEEQEGQFKESIISHKKALFILDLDNTILHSIQLFKVPEDTRQTIKDYMIIPPEADTFIQRSFVKIRPYFEKFLELILPLYQIYVYTKGTRLYAQQICRAIRTKYSHLLNDSLNFTRMTLVSRDEDPNPKKSLNFILPNLRDFILILDDRRDVWDHSPLCVFTKPYYYFFFCANIEGKEKIEAAEWQKGGGSLIKVPVQEHTVPKHDKQEQNENKQGQGLKIEEETQKNGLSKSEELQKESLIQKKADNEKEKMSLRISTNPDCFLLYAALTMIKSHEIYFRSREMKQCPKRKTGRFTDMAHVQKQIRAGILKGKKACLLIPNYKVSNNTYRRAIKLGIEVLEDNETMPNFVIRSNDYRKNANNFTEISMKLKNYGQALKIPIVSESWIDLCYEYCYTFPHDNFICTCPSSIIMYPNPEVLEDTINKTLIQSLPYVKKELKMEDTQLISQ